MTSWADGVDVSSHKVSLSPVMDHERRFRVTTGAVRRLPWGCTENAGSSQSGVQGTYKEKGEERGGRRVGKAGLTQMPHRQCPESMKMLQFLLNLKGRNQL
jgi:hypothetical protein